MGDRSRDWRLCQRVKDIIVQMGEEEKKLPKSYKSAVSPSAPGVEEASPPLNFEEIGKKYLKHFCEREYDDIEAMITTEASAKIPFRSVAQGYYGWPNVKIEDEVKKNDDGTYTVTALFVRNYRPTVLCIACCTGTPMKLLMNDTLTFTEDGKISYIARE